MNSTPNLPALRPACNTCGQFLELRPGRTREQKFCGTWYDHPPTQFGHLIGHTATVLLPSKDLTASLSVDKPARAA